MLGESLEKKLFNSPLLWQCLVSGPASEPLSSGGSAASAAFGGIARVWKKNFGPGPRYWEVVREPCSCRATPTSPPIGSQTASCQCFAGLDPRRAKPAPANDGEPASTAVPALQRGAWILVSDFVDPAQTLCQRPASSGGEARRALAGRAGPATPPRRMTRSISQR